MRLSGKKQLISSAQVGGCLELDVQLAVTILKFIRNCCILLKLLKAPQCLQFRLNVTSCCSLLYLCIIASLMSGVLCF